MRKTVFFPVFLLTAALGISLIALAQGSGSYSFRNFKVYKQGLYRQDSQGYRDGKPFGNLISETNCAGLTSVQQAQTLRKTADAIAPNCSTKVLTDTTTLAVAEQTCDAGAAQKVIRTTMKVVDDQVYEVNTQMTAGGMDFMDSRTRITYVGACTPAQVSGAAMPKPSKEECAELPGMKQQMQESAGSCATMPADYKPRCEAAMKMMQQNVKQFEAMCK